MKLIKSSLLVKLVILILVVYATVTLVKLQSRISDKKAEADALTSSITTAEQENGRLQDAIDKLDTPEGVENVARDKLDMAAEGEIIFYDVSGLREAQKDLNSIVENNLLAVTVPAHLYALVGATDVKAEFTNNSKSDTYKVEIRRNKDNALIADAFELAAGKSILTLTLLEAPEFGNVDCTVTVTAFRDGKQIGSMQTELTLHAAYLWPKEVL